MIDKVEIGTTNPEYYFQVDARAGPPGFVDYDSYISNRYNTFGAVYGALTSFQPGRQFRDLRRVQGMWIWEKGMGKIEVHENDTATGIIAVEDLAKMGISEGDFDMIIDSLNKKIEPQLGVQNDVSGGSILSQIPIIGPLLKRIGIVGK